MIILTGDGSTGLMARVGLREYRKDLYYEDGNRLMSGYREDVRRTRQLYTLQHAVYLGNNLRDLSKL